MRNVEIEQIAEFEAAEAQITQHLSSMDWKDCLKCFQLDDHQIVHQEVDSVAILDLQILVADRNRNLFANRETLFAQLMRETKLIRVLEQARSERSVNLHGGRDDHVTDLIFGHPPRPLRNLRVLCAKKRHGPRPPAPSGACGAATAPSPCGRTRSR